MTVLRPTDIELRVAWLGVVRDRRATLEAAAVETLTLGWAGAEGDCHGGLTRPSCSRVKLQHPRGTEIRNTRQLSLVSAEELAAIAADLGVPALPPAWTGANVMVAGAPDFTLVPPGSRLVFGDGTTLAVDMRNGPCRFVGDVIEARHPGKGGAFPRVATDRRGVTAWVERPGALRVGGVARLHVPPQHIYAPALARPAAAAR